MDIDVSSDSNRLRTESTEHAVLPSPRHHWYIVRGILQWSRAGRRGRPLYEERLVLIDAPTPAEAISVARKEAKQGCLKGQKNVDILELMLPAQHSGHGHELCRSEYRSTESPDKFVARRFESGT
ncbi:DUF4288 domain-containing protein [Arthrobacter crystallopoietes]|uniref:DUF4288 domain-containing protein n=1 Tax=Crystallibacter crystallopoietes TaxID=37928 RepID=UPI003D64CFF8